MRFFALQKKDTIKLILSKAVYSEAEKTTILNYCESDVRLLYKGASVCAQIIYDQFSKTSSKHQKTIKRNYLESMIDRAKFSAHSAHIEATGYPVNKEKILKFSENAKFYREDTAVDINKQFPDNPFFIYDVKRERHVFKKAVFLEHVDANPELRQIWSSSPDFLTPKGELSLSGDVIDGVLKKVYRGPKYQYERCNFLAQVKRFKQIEKNISGFTPGSKTKILDKFCEDDSRIRFYQNIYGSKTSRSQPSSSSVLLLKSRWIRGFVEPSRDDRFMTAIDYSSQEVLIQACLSGDENLYSSYQSSDVYFDFAKKIGLVPESAVRKDYEFERTIAKTAFLAIGYGMGEVNLAKSIQDKLQGTDREFTVKHARKIKKEFMTIYSKYARWRRNVIANYSRRGYAYLPDKWMLLGGPIRPTTLANWPVQGHGAVVLREAVGLCFANKISICLTLHDALYAEIFTEKQIRTFQDCMREAFINIMTQSAPKYSEWSKSIRIDTACWGSYFDKHGLDCFEDKSIETKRLYLPDEQAVKDYYELEKYFT